MFRRIAMLATMVPLAFVAMSAQAQNVTIGFLGLYNPWKVAIVDGDFEKATDAKINWKRFDSGTEVINAMASGDVHIALVDSSSIAAGVNRDQPIEIELFWIAEDIAKAEALVVRNGSGISTRDDLKGKKLAVPFASTAHFHSLFALEQFGIKPSEVEILNMQPTNIAAAWRHGDIDAAFIWDPALGRIKETGKVLIASDELSSMNLDMTTFDGMVVQTDFGRKNSKFMCKFVQTIAEADEVYRSDPNSFGPESENAKKIVKLVGGEPDLVKLVLDLYRFPTLEEQGSDRWIGGGNAGGAAMALRATSEFLQPEKKIDGTLLDDYGAVVNDNYIKAARRDGGC